MVYVKQNKILKLLQEIVDEKINMFREGGILEWIYLIWIENLVDDYVLWEIY